jgi:hypothetical protein
MPDCTLRLVSAVSCGYSPGLVHTTDPCRRYRNDARSFSRSSHRAEIVAACPAHRCGRQNYGRLPHRIRARGRRDQPQIHKSHDTVLAGPQESSIAPHSKATDPPRIRVVGYFDSFASSGWSSSKVADQYAAPRHSLITRPQLHLTESASRAGSRCASTR